MIVRSTELLCALVATKCPEMEQSSAGRPHNGGGHITWIMFPGT